MDNPLNWLSCIFNEIKDFTRKLFEKLYNFYLTKAKFSVIIGQRRMR